jgi:hypothetical protein
MHSHQSIPRLDSRTSSFNRLDIVVLFSGLEESQFLKKLQKNSHVSARVTITNPATALGLAGILTSLLFPSSMKQEQGDLGGGSFPFQSNFDDDFVPSKRVATGNPMTKEEKSQWSFGPNDYSRDEEKRKQKLKSNDVKKVCLLLFI